VKPERQLDELAPVTAATGGADLDRHRPENLRDANVSGVKRRE
jgi:hypothetical protein